MTVYVTWMYANGQAFAVGVSPDVLSAMRIGDRVTKGLGRNPLPYEEVLKGIAWVADHWQLKFEITKEEIGEEGLDLTNRKVTR